MPWKEVSTMSLRSEFVMLAEKQDGSFRELCRRFGISAKTGYKFLERYRQQGEKGLADRSRRPKLSPSRTCVEIEERIVAMRDEHSAWGGRKIRRRLQDLGVSDVPPASTITSILHRYGRIDPTQAHKHTAWQRFEGAAPNDLWQMDFKGHFALAQGRCHPLTVLDDHSRYSLGLDACGDERTETVQERLTTVFRRYGLPHMMLVDNGSPWGSGPAHPYTPLTVWLLRLGVGVSHGRPYHPQTQGKDERFHRTLNLEVLRDQVFRDLAHCQSRFHRWRYEYNFERPHEGIGNEVPASRYHSSARSFPEILPPIEYPPGAIVRKVQAGGEITYRGHVVILPKAFRGYPVALMPSVEDSVFTAFFCHHRIARVDMNDKPEES